MRLKGKMALMGFLVAYGQRKTETEERKRGEKLSNHLITDQFYKLRIPL